MNTIVTFIVEATVGAVVALLFAPQSGEELRTRMREEAQVERPKVAETNTRRACKICTAGWTRCSMICTSHSADGEGAS